MKNILKRICLFLYIFLLVFVLNGCANGRNPQNEFTGEDGTLAAESVDFYEVLQQMELCADNTEDTYSRTKKASFRLRFDDYANGEIGMSTCSYILSKSGGAYFAKHLYEEPANCWDEMKICPANGQEYRVRLDFQQEDFNQAVCVGAIWNSDHYFMYKMQKDEENAEEYQHLFFETDEALSVQREYTVDFLREAIDDYEIVLDLKVDRNGAVHLLAYVYEEGWHYYVMDPEGGLLVKDETVYQKRPKLVFSYAGDVFVQTAQIGMQESAQKVYLKRADFETKEIVPSYEFQLREGVMQDRVYTLFDENTFLIVDTRGIYKQSIEGTAEEELYIWRKHATGVTDVEDVIVLENKELGVIYHDSTTANYIHLTVTKDNKSIKKIEFAVSPANTWLYSKVITMFNREFPAYHITMKADYETQPLLTKITAGEGPVLIDTTLLDFEENMELWLSLDEMFNYLNPDEAISPKLSAPGMIKGNRYGVVSCFWIDTLVSDCKREQWNYDAILDMMEGSAGISGVDYSSTAKQMILSYFTRSMEDSYLFDAQEDRVVFRKDRLIRVMNLPTMKERTDDIEQVGLWPDGKVLCHPVSIYKPEDIELYLTYYGEGKFVGYPSDQNAGHYISANSPLTVRRNTTPEEQAIACLFMKYLLSYDVQSELAEELSFPFSIRCDVIQEQFNRMRDGIVVNKYLYPPIQIDQVDRERDKKILDEILEEAVPYPHLTAELSEIFEEELNHYQKQSVGLEEVVVNIGKRVQLYLDEIR